MRPADPHPAGTDRPRPPAARVRSIAGEALLQAARRCTDLEVRQWLERLAEGDRDDRERAVTEEAGHLPSG
jgi:hypothetical protein